MLLVFLRRMSASYTTGGVLFSPFFQIKSDPASLLLSGGNERTNRIEDGLEIFAVPVLQFIQSF